MSDTPDGADLPLVLIASVARNGSIGQGSELVWREPEDQRWFRRQTLGCPVVMGRKTWESLPPSFRPLPGRRNIVISRQADYSAPSAEVADSLENGLKLASTIEPAVRPMATTLIFIIGGEQIYTRCAACHVIESNRTGPQHCGLFGRRAGTAPGFDGYSKAMRDSKIVWNERSLDVFLQAPMQAVPGTYMGYAGVKDAQERADLIAWLRLATEPATRCRLSQ